MIIRVEDGTKQERKQFVIDLIKALRDEYHFCEREENVIEVTEKKVLHE